VSEALQHAPIISETGISSQGSGIRRDAVTTEP
jgi:hypothetical protein